MNYKIIPTKIFLKDIKSLKKKYIHIVEDIDLLVEQLEKNPKMGISLGKSLYKIRLQSRDKQTGKRGGFRVIYYFALKKNLYLIKIYSKNINDNFIRKELEKLIEALFT